MVKINILDRKINIRYILSYFMFTFGKLLAYINKYLSKEKNYEIKRIKT